MLRPTSLTDLCDAVRSARRVIAVGGETRPRLAAVDATRLTTAGLTGITEYDPAEFTITALAGTPLATLTAALADRGQHLPFDPLLVEAGSTVGGCVAANACGPGRFRHGGIRDFILGVRFVDGLGRLLRLGGKVVKNAAGFDVPRFLVGSLGRFGVIGEVTFKVFPRPAASCTLRLPCSATRLATLARSRYDIDALDVPPGGESLLVRLAGPPAAIATQAREIGGESTDDSIWAAIRETPWRFVTPITPAEIGRFARAHVTCAGNLAWSLDEPPMGLALRGAGPLWVGGRPRLAIEAAVKRALDPDGRFPDLDDGADAAATASADDACHATT